ncbi:MAG: transcriptional repressor LexA [Limosilactobacillus sp.]|nr:transcriptional repressor LexA [Limosilactobacillus sp.]
MPRNAHDKQLAILSFINQQVDLHGYPPTVREICNAVNLSSTSTVHGHIKRLIDLGYLHKDPSKPRALEITALGLELLGISPHQDQIPLLGEVAAGEPILAEQDATDFFPIPPTIPDHDDLFMLTIKGTSMIKMGILNGDKVIVRRQSAASNGDVVIAMTSENEATCKRFYKEDGYYRLQPENDELDPIIVDEVTILGKVVGLFRDDIY